jgi:carbon monoxide dehydrogenase subunit G
LADHAHESIVIQGDPATIMAVIADFGAYPQWAGPVKKAEVLEPGASGERAQKVKIDVELMGLSDSYVNAYEWDGDSKVSWTMLEGRSQKSQVGSYTLEPSGSGTKVTYDLTVDLAIPVPGLIRRRIQGKVVDAALKDLKKRVEG